MLPTLLTAAMLSMGAVEAPSAVAESPDGGLDEGSVLSPERLRYAAITGGIHAAVLSGTCVATGAACMLPSCVLCFVPYGAFLGIPLWILSTIAWSATVAVVSLLASLGGWMYAGSTTNHRPKPTLLLMGALLPTIGFGLLSVFSTMTGVFAGVFGAVAYVALLSSPFGGVNPALAWVFAAAMTMAFVGTLVAPFVSVLAGGLASMGAVTTAALLLSRRDPADEPWSFTEPRAFQQLLGLEARETSE